MRRQHFECANKYVCAKERDIEKVCRKEHGITKYMYLQKHENNAFLGFLTILAKESEGKKGRGR